MLRDAERAAQLVRDAGGKIVGRTRLQKLAYFLEATGLDKTYGFEYKHYGPFSQGLAEAMSMACALSKVKEQENHANWGGSYSVFTADGPVGADPTRIKLIGVAVGAEPIALELAATALFLSREGHDKPWHETARRKPEKATSLGQAKVLYSNLRKLPTPVELPELPD